MIICFLDIAVYTLHDQAQTRITLHDVSRREIPDERTLPHSQILLCHKNKHCLSCDHKKKTTENTEEGLVGEKTSSEGLSVPQRELELEWDLLHLEVFLKQGLGQMCPREDGQLQDEYLIEILNYLQTHFCYAYCLMCVYSTKRDSLTSKKTKFSCLC